MKNKQAKIKKAKGGQKKKKQTVIQQPESILSGVMAYDNRHSKKYLRQNVNYT